MGWEDLSEEQQMAAVRSYYNDPVVEISLTLSEASALEIALGDGWEDDKEVTSAIGKITDAMNLIGKTV